MQIFILRTFRTWKAASQSMKSEKDYGQLSVLHQTILNCWQQNALRQRVGCSATYVNPLIWSMQVPSLAHGLLEHSSISIWQSTPVGTESVPWWCFCTSVSAKARNCSRCLVTARHKCNLSNTDQLLQKIEMQRPLTCESRRAGASISGAAWFAASTVLTRIYERAHWFGSRYLS